MIWAGCGWSMNESITLAGQATADNLPAQIAQPCHGGSGLPLPQWQQHFTSDDYTEYTWHRPLCD